MVARPSSYYKPIKDCAKSNEHSLFKKPQTIAEAVLYSIEADILRRYPARERFLHLFRLKEARRRRMERSLSLRLAMLQVSKRFIRRYLHKFPTGFIAAVSVPLAAYGYYSSTKSTELVAANAFHLNLPGLQRQISPPQKLSLETCQSLNYLNKLDWKTYQRINYYPGSTFIFWHPNLRLSNGRFYAGVFKSNLKETLADQTLLGKNYVVLSKNNNLLYGSPFLYQNHQSLKRASDLKIRKTQFSENQLRKLQYWQRYFIELDTLPLKTNHFFNPMKPLKKGGSGKRLTPLFNYISEEAHRIKTPFRLWRWGFSIPFREVIDHEALTESHMEKLSRSLIESSPFSKRRFRGHHKIMQYKMANNFFVMQDIIRLYVHCEPMVEENDEHLIIDYFYNPIFNLQNRLQKFTMNKSPLRDISNQKDLIEGRLRSAFQEDVSGFGRQAHHPANLIEDLRSPWSFTRINPSPRKNPFNVIYRNQSSISLESKDDFSVLPKFQRTLYQYIRKAHLNHQIRFAPYNALLNLNPISSQYSVKRLRINRFANQKRVLNIRNHMIKGQSQFLKHRFSGYFSPDTSVSDLTKRKLYWQNRFFVKGAAKKDEIFLKIVGPADQQWFFKQISQQTVQRSQLTTAIKSEAPSLKPLMVDERLFFGQNTPDFGAVMVDKDTDGPKYFRYGHYGWLKWRDPPKENEDDRNYEFVLNKPYYILDTENALNIGPDWADEHYYLADNLRCLPLPSPLITNPSEWAFTSSSAFERELPQQKATLYKLNFHTFSYHFNLGTCYSSDLEQYVEKKPRFDIYNYQGLFRHSLFANFPITDPLFIGQFFLLAYFYRVAKRIYIDYSDGFWEGLELFLLRLEIKDLLNFKTLGRFVLPPSNITFSHVMGGSELIKRFLPTILFLRNKRHPFSEIPVPDPGLTSYLEFSWDHAFNQDQYEKAAKVFEWEREPESVGKSSETQDDEESFEKRMLEGLAWSKLPESEKGNEPFLIRKEIKSDEIIDPEEESYRTTLKKVASENQKKQPALFYNSDIVPKGFLLIGSPGTGKTFLVKALSGETGCPVITSTYETTNDSYNADQTDQYQMTSVIRKLFKTARSRAPSILFIDELDTLGAKRSQVLGSAITQPLGPKLFYTRNDYIQQNAFSVWQRNSLLEQSPDLNRTSLPYWSIFNPKVAHARVVPRTFVKRYNTNLTYTIPDKEGYLSSLKPKKETPLESVTILLCELDGIYKSDNIVVIGATNRPSALDPALIRPGRLGEVIYLDLPNKQKRFELLKFYAHERFTENVDWDFFASYGQTGGFSAAHMKVAVNASTLTLIKSALIKAPVLQSWNPFRKKSMTPHTNLTIEHGVQSVRFQNLYVKQASYRLAKLFNQSFFTPMVYKTLFNPQSSVFLTEEVETLPRDANYIVTQPHGISLPVAKKIDPFKIDPSLGADVSAPTRFPVFKPCSISKRIYKRFHKKIRLLYLLDEKENFSFPPEWKHYEDRFMSGSDYFERLLNVRGDKKEIHRYKKYKAYSHRMFKAHLFGLHLLIDSSYFVGNPFMFSLRRLDVKLRDKIFHSKVYWTEFSQLNIINYNLITQPCNKSLLMPVDKQSRQWQTSVFGDELSFKRAAYYSAAKALVISLLDETLFDATVLSFWSNIKLFHEQRMTQENFIQQIAGQLITKKHFEMYLLALVAGKVGEQFLLADEKVKNYSDLGLTELHQMGWLANIMVEKGLLYSTLPATVKQSSIKLMSSPLNGQMHGLSQTHVPGKPTTNTDISHDWGTMEYWWTSKLSYENSNLMFKDGVWTIYFEHGNDIYNRKTFLIPYEKAYYESTIVDHSQILSEEELYAAYLTKTKKNLQDQNNDSDPVTFTESTDLTDQTNQMLEQEKSSEPIGTAEKDKKTEVREETEMTKTQWSRRKKRMLQSQLNTAILTELLETTEFSWNSFNLTLCQNTFSQLIFESFTKVFCLLENNRPWFDCLVHEFYHQNRLTGLEVKRMADVFLNPMESGDLKLPIYYPFRKTVDLSDLSEKEEKDFNKEVNLILADSVLEKTIDLSDLSDREEEDINEK